MKKVFASLVIVLGLGTTAMAFPGAAEMEKNYSTCIETDDTFFGRFGQYLVSFDLSTAADICNASDPSLNGPAQVMACRFDGQWLYAGYYCSAPLN